MLTLLLGADDFSKKEYIGSLAQKEKAEVEVFVDTENLPNADNLASQDLFSQPKVFVLQNLIAKFNQPETIGKLIASKNSIILVEEKLDKRLTENKELLSNSNIAIKQFSLPHAMELNAWIAEHVKSCGGKISQSAIEALAVALGRDDAKETKF